MLKKASIQLLAALFGLVVLCVFSVTASAKDLVVGTVNVGVLNMREAASTESKIIDKLYKGEKLIILDSEGEWHRVNYNSREGYINGNYLDLSGVTETDLGKGVIVGSLVNLREAPSTDANIITKLKKDVIVDINSIQNDWYSVTYNSTTGYIFADYLELSGDQVEALPSGDAQSAGDDSASAEDTAPASGKGAEIVAYAKKYIGVRYSYGGASPSGFDCSGFTSYVYKQNGYPINRTASSQLSNGKKVTKAELQPGDLVFFKSPSRPSIPAGHVGIYVGDGKFIHSVKPGTSVQISALNSGYYSKNYTGARRIV